MHSLGLFLVEYHAHFINMNCTPRVCGGVGGAGLPEYMVVISGSKYSGLEVRNMRTIRLCLQLLTFLTCNMKHWLPTRNMWQLLENPEA